MKRRSPGKRLRKETVFLRIKKNAKQLVIVFSKGTAVPLLSPPPHPPVREFFYRVLHRYYSDNVFSRILGVTLKRKFDNLLWKIV